jgi:chromate transporter
LIFSLFVTFFKIGLFTFGGGYAMISHIRDEIVEKKHWIDDDGLSDIIAIAESTPGPIAINIATFIGYKRARFAGAFAATAGVIIPAFLVMLVIALFLDGISENRYVAYAFEGIKCAVAFLIIKAGVEMFFRLPKKPFPVVVFILVLSALTVLDIFSVSFGSVWFIAIGGVAGLTLFLLSQKGGKAK